jgi:hypothetical protein
MFVVEIVLRDRKQDFSNNGVMLYDKYTHTQRLSQAWSPNGERARPWLNVNPADKATQAID